MNVVLSVVAKKPEYLPQRLMTGNPQDGDPTEHAPYSIEGDTEEIFFWSYSLEEALAGAKWLTNNGLADTVTVWGWTPDGQCNRAVCCITR
jgi:hypothetical protein